MLSYFLGVIGRQDHFLFFAYRFMPGFHVTSAGKPVHTGDKLDKFNSICPQALRLSMKNEGGKIITKHLKKYNSWHAP